MKANLLFVLTLFALLTACNTRPDYVIDEETMTDLLVDVHLSEGLLDVQGRQMSDKDNYGQEVMAAVLLKHGVTRAQYDTSLVWYSQNLKYLIRIYGDVDKELESRAEQWSVLANEGKKTLLNLSGDCVDLWALDRYVLLDESRLSHVTSWLMPTDSCFYAGDTLCWKLHVHQMPAGQGVVVSMALLSEDATYHTDVYEVGQSTSPIGCDSIVVMTLAPEKDVKLSKLSLSMNLLHTASLDSIGLYPALVDGLELIRVHRK